MLVPVMCRASRLKSLLTSFSVILPVIRSLYIASNSSSDSRRVIRGCSRMWKWDEIQGRFASHRRVPSGVAVSQEWSSTRS